MRAPVRRGAPARARDQTDKHRTVRLLAPLAQELREYQLAIGRPPDAALVLADENDPPWDETAWQMWRCDRWVPPCRAAGLDPEPRPYDLRHSFASLLLAEGRQPLYVARQLGNALAVLTTTYAHLFEDAERIDPEREIAQARAQACALRVRQAGG